MVYRAWWLECSPIAWKSWVQPQVESYQKLKKMVHDASLLNIQHYKGKVEQSKIKRLPLHLSVVK